MFQDMMVWQALGAAGVIAVLVLPIGLAQVPYAEVDVAGPLNDTGLLPDCRPFPGITNGTLDVSNGPGGQAFVRACRVASEGGVGEAVTGHSVFLRETSWPAPEVRFTVRPQPFETTEAKGSLPDPTVSPPEPSAPQPDEVRMVECVAWSNGYNLDVRPALDARGRDNHHFSDADQPALARPHHDAAGQDHDADDLVDGCGPELSGLGSGANRSVGLVTDFAVVAGMLLTPSGEPAGRFAAIMERGDCALSHGTDFRFRGHLDFVDPNDVYHEVQEYDYLCPWTGPGNAVPADASAAASGLLPAPQSDPVGPTERCDPVVLLNPDGPAGPSRRCRGTVQDLTRERVWVTELHEPRYDWTGDTWYSFAVVVDTCAAFNVRDGVLASVAGVPLVPFDPIFDPFGYTRERHAHPVQAIASDTQQPVPGHADDACTDGSSFSFDDTERARRVHSGAPAGIGAGGLHDGNSFDFNQVSETVGKHRTNCRHNQLEWPHVWRTGSRDDCYMEEHRAAPIDVYVYQSDPTGGAFAAHSNGLTGPYPYRGPGEPSHPDEEATS